VAAPFDLFVATAAGWDAEVLRADLSIIAFHVFVLTSLVRAPVERAETTVVAVLKLQAALGYPRIVASRSGKAGILGTGVLVRALYCAVLALVGRTPVDRACVAVVAFGVQKAAVLDGQEEATHLGIAEVLSAGIAVFALDNLFINALSHDTCAGTAFVRLVAVRVHHAAARDLAEGAPGFRCATVLGAWMIVVAIDRGILARMVDARVKSAFVAVGALESIVAATFDHREHAPGFRCATVLRTIVKVIADKDLSGLALALRTLVTQRAQVAIIALGWNVQVIALSPIAVAKVCGAEVAVVAVNQVALAESCLAVIAKRA